MIYALKVYSKDRWIRYLFALAFLSNILLWGYTAYQAQYINRELTFIVHTTIVSGANLYGQWWSIYYFPLAGLLLLIANFFAAFHVFSKEITLARVLALVSVIIQFLLVGLIVTLIRLNT